MVNKMNNLIFFVLAYVLLNVGFYIKSLKFIVDREILLPQQLYHLDRDIY